MRAVLTLSSPPPPLPRSMRLVDVRNTQRKFPVDIAAVQRSVALIKAQLGVSSFRVHVWFCSEPKVCGLTVRCVDRPCGV